jgi:hypothetical protein
MEEGRWSVARFSRGIMLSRENYCHTAIARQPLSYCYCAPTAVITLSRANHCHFDRSSGYNPERSGEIPHLLKTDRGTRGAPTSVILKMQNAECFSNAECKMQNAELLTCRKRNFWYVLHFLPTGNIVLSKPYPKFAFRIIRNCALSCHSERSEESQPIKNARRKTVEQSTNRRKTFQPPRE